MANNFPVAGNGNFSSVNLLGVTDGYLQFSVPATVTSYQLLWPSAQASGIKQLQNDGSGNLSWVDPAGGAVTTMAAFGSTPNANGASISSNTLTLQPASSTLPGGVTAGTQTFGGAKTFAAAATFAAAVTAQAQVTVTVTSASGSIVLQPTDHVNNAGAIQYKQVAASGRYNWLAGADVVSSDSFQIVPSTAVDGSTFSSAAISVAAATGATTTKNLTVGGPTASTGGVLTVQPADATNYDSAIMLKNGVAAARYNWLVASGLTSTNTFEVFPSTATNGSTFSTRLLAIAQAGGVTLGGVGNVTAKHVFLGHSVGLPSVTTAQRDAVTGVNGMIIYNNTTDKVQAFAAGVWVDLH